MPSETLSPDHREHPAGPDPDPVRPDLTEAIERWDRKGLLQPGQADLLLADLAEHRPSAPGGRPPTPRPRALSFESAMQAGLEAVGYLGAALVVGAVMWLLDVPNWTEPALMALLAVVSMGCGYAVFRLTPAEPGLASRLATVVGSAGLFSFMGFLMLWLEPECGPGPCRWAVERLLPMAIAVPVTVAAWWLHRREENALTHAWLGMGVATTLFLLSQVPFEVGSRSWRAQEVAGALLLLPAGLAWTWASETGRIRPAWIGTIGASGVALASTITLSDFDLFASRSNDLVPLALLVFGIAYVSLGMTVEKWRLTTIGALVLVWGVPWTLTDVFGLSQTTTAFLLLPIGLALVGFATKRLLER